MHHQQQKMYTGLLMFLFLALRQFQRNLYRLFFSKNISHTLNSSQVEETSLKLNPNASLCLLSIIGSNRSYIVIQTSSIIQKMSLCKVSDATVSGFRCQEKYIVRSNFVYLTFNKFNIFLIEKYKAYDLLDT